MAANEIIIDEDSFTDEKIKSGSVSMVASVRGDELEYNTLEAELEFDEKYGTLWIPADADYILTADGMVYTARPYYTLSTADPSDYVYGTPVAFYHNGDFIGKFYMSGITRTGKNLYTIKCISAVGLLAKSYHYGGIYRGDKFSEVLSVIIGGTIAYTLDDELADEAVYGWLPIATRRENLRQLLFAMGACIKQDDDGEPFITGFSTDSVSDIADSRVYAGGSVEYPNPKTVVSVSEHQYAEYDSDEEVTLFDGSVTSSQIVTPNGKSVYGSIIKFDEPCHDLSADGTEILESGVNYAILSPSSACTLTGKIYTHTVRQVTRPEYSSGSCEVAVEDATLVSAANSENVASRLYNYYAGARTVSSDIIVGSERPADAVALYDAYDEYAKGLLASLDITLSSVLKASATVIADYEPGEAGNFYSHEAVLTASGTWTVPSGVTKIRVALIGGGSGGASGADGTDGEDGSSEDTAYQSGGVGGAGGAGGTGGNILIATLTVTPGNELAAVIGEGGAGGTRSSPNGFSGGDTSFGEYTSADGTPSASGFTDALTGDVYAPTGADGIDGGSGGGEDSPNGGDVTGSDGSAYFGGVAGASVTENGVTAYPGLGGGAAVGFDGLDGGDGSIVSTDDSLAAYGGAGGDGASVSASGADGEAYGAGGAGGHGGGGGGAGGRLSEYSVKLGLEEAVLTELNATSAVYTAYPSVCVDSLGTISVSGTAVTVGFSDCEGKYAEINGTVMKFTRVNAVKAEGDVLCEGGAIGLSSSTLSGVMVLTRGGSCTVYDTLRVTSGEISVEDAETVYYNSLSSPSALIGKFFVHANGTIYYISGYTSKTVTVSGSSYQQYSYTGTQIASALDDRYVWYAAPVRALSGDEAGSGGAGGKGGSGGNGGSGANGCIIIYY
ncbi:MAG: hypothetical protein LIO55_00595 [Oscillospiraceae bacterium]|nr:hypothetical protein [Oscillospiraceae bacterium]